MEKQGTLDAFCPNQVSSDAAAVTGRIDRIIYPSSSSPPCLSFVQPGLTNEEQTAFPLTAVLGERIRVQLQSEQFCTNCGSSAGQSICPSCAGSPPLATCVKQPAKGCEYAECPFPDYKERSCAHEFVVYLVAADGVKVGITKRTRTLSRWQEQGASHALPIATAPNRKAAGIIERAVSQIDRIGQRLKHKWYEPMDEPETKLADAALDAREAFPKRLADCFRWPTSASHDKLRREVTSVPYLSTPELNHRLASRYGDLQPGNPREGRVIGVRGALIATDGFIINTKRHAGHGITIETEAPFVGSFDADAVADEASSQAGNRSVEAVPDGGEEHTGSNETADSNSF